MPPKSRPYQLLMPDHTGKRKHVGYYATKLEREIAKQHIETSGLTHTKIYRTKRGDYTTTVKHLIRRSIVGNRGEMIHFTVVDETPEDVIHRMRDAMNVIDHCYPDEQMTNEYLPDGVKVIRGSKSAQEWRLYKAKRITTKPKPYNKKDDTNTVYYRELPQRLIEKNKNADEIDTLPGWYSRYDRDRKQTDHGQLPEWLLPK